RQAINQSPKRLYTRKPRRRNGAMAASTHFVKTLGARDRPNGSALNWYAIPPNANLRYLRCLWWIGTWTYASFKSIVINQLFGLMNCTSRRGVSILNRSGMSALFNTRRSNLTRGERHAAAGRG